MAIDAPPRPNAFRARPTGSSRARSHEVNFARRSRLADLLVAACWTSAAASITLFLGYGGANQFTTSAQAVTSLGIIAGLVGTDLILVMIVLAARLPLIDRAVGNDRAMALHRSLGKPVLYLIIAHVVLLLVGYGMASKLSAFDEIAPMWSIPDLPLAFIGFGLLIAVVVTSVVTVRRHFRYEFWHLIHLLAYVAVLVALPHELSVGGLLAVGTFQRGYWIALYIVAFGAIGIYRFVIPVIRSVRHDLRISRIERVSDDVVSIYLTGRNLTSLGSGGGQYFVWRFWSARTWWHSHPISLSAVPTATELRITVRELGRGTTQIARLRSGTRVWLEGPYGLFTDAGRTAPKLAVVAAGIGITPIRALLEHSRLAPGEATILLRGTS
ncbi:MAG TPA: ferric reductase-like transmembrane domain-containing protein, partial [Galbitalea sp.]|nr:ferric reductase-like transmembrane domain-containing protein [Galbitalea sp.]